jgi:mRNA interferase HigB
VRVISKRALREFWEARKEDAEVAEKDLSTWYKIAKHADWPHFAGLKQTLGSADQVGNCVVFDVGNNRYRLIGRVNYNKGIVYVLRVMDHKEYDNNLWQKSCRCHEPPPGAVPNKETGTKRQRCKPASGRRGKRKKRR